MPPALAAVIPAIAGAAVGGLAKGGLDIIKGGQERKGQKELATINRTAPGLGGNFQTQNDFGSQMTDMDRQKLSLLNKRPFYR